MFRKSPSSKQIDAFSSEAALLNRTRSVKIYHDPAHWHNQFFDKITCKIPEELFKDLFHSTQGAPNAPVRVLLAMMLLKEAFGYSDAVLFEQANFNLLVRRALGLIDQSESVPAESTYYLFRKNMLEWDKTSGTKTLIEQVFDHITASQLEALELKVAHVRMDSKLFSSNIANYSRYELVAETIKRAWKSVGDRPIELSSQDRKVLDELMKANSANTVYHNSGEYIKQQLSDFAGLIERLLLACDQAGIHGQALQILQTVFSQQYTKQADSTQSGQLLGGKQLKSDSVQSPDDPDCGYRNKTGTPIRGYTGNITETCTEENPVNLIVSCQIDTVVRHDASFVLPALAQAEAISQDKVKKIYADGAYNSPDNDEHLAEIDLVLTGLQGGQPRFKLDYSAQGDQLVATDTLSGKVYQAHKCRRFHPRKNKVKSNQGEQQATSQVNAEPRWRIQVDGKNYYFAQKAIQASAKRATLEGRSKQERNKRNNVEATIYRFGRYLNNQQSKYRGLIKQMYWANLRCLWINFTRIMVYEVNLMHAKG